MADVPTTEHLIGDQASASDERAALGYLAIMRDRGDLTEPEFDRIGRMLGLLPDPDVDNRPKRGHLRGARGRAMPADWNRRGAVGA